MSHYRISIQKIYYIIFPAIIIITIIILVTLYFSKILIQISSYKFQIVNNYVQLEKNYEITVIN